MSHGILVTDRFPVTISDTEGSTTFAMNTIGNRDDDVEIVTHGICRTGLQAEVERLAEGAAGLEIDSRF